MPNQVLPTRGKVDETHYVCILAVFVSLQGFYLLEVSEISSET